ncbi:MAG: VOC family protein [Chloroflexi bacterium]|nr:MAG: VOC family protein [Chloroflexota bacterium]
MLRCSHLLCTVHDLGQAVKDFRDLGFTVEWGSDPRRAHNALIWFPEGPFIELAHFPPSVGASADGALGERLARWVAPGEGWRDVALETDATDLAGARTWLEAAGVDVSPVMDGMRVRPDGEEVRYQYLMPHSARLPFVVSAYDPPQRPEAVTHPNGASPAGCARRRARPRKSGRWSSRA